MKSKGLQRLRWYCQVCEKQCRDENGFKCHTQSEAHLRQMLVVGENAGRHINDFSSQFQAEFVGLLSRRYARTCDTPPVYSLMIQIRDNSCTCQSSVPGIYSGQTSSPHERNKMGHTYRICQTPWSFRYCTCRRDREGVVHRVD